MLTNRAKISTFVQIASGISAAEVDRYLMEAEEFDLRELMTDEFYHDLTTNQAEDKFKILIDGDSYDYEDRTYTFSGIDRVLAYFVYARLMMYGNVVTTSHGIVVKKTPDSNPLAIEERKNFYYAHRAHANKIFNGVKKYVERHITEYPSWNEDDCHSTSVKSFQTTVIQ